MNVETGLLEALFRPQRASVHATVFHPQRLGGNEATSGGGSGDVLVHRMVLPRSVTLKDGTSCSANQYYELLEQLRQLVAAVESDRTLDLHHAHVYVLMALNRDAPK